MAESPELTRYAGLLASARSAFSQDPTYAIALATQARATKERKSAMVEAPSTVSLTFPSEQSFA